MKTENVIFVDDWLLINTSLKEEEWRYRFCSCLKADCPKRTLSDAHELYERYLWEKTRH